MSALFVPDNMEFYGWDSGGNYVQLGPRNEIPDMLLQVLPLDCPILGAQDPSDLVSALASIQAPGSVQAQASALAAAATAGMTVAQAAFAVAGPSPLA